MAREDSGDPPEVGVNADDLDADLGKADRERQAHVSEPDDGE